MGLDGIRNQPIVATAAIGTGALAGGVGTAAVVLGRKHGGKFAATPTILKSAALPLAIGALAGGAAMGALADKKPDAARTATISTGLSVALGGGMGAWSGAKQWKAASEVARQGMPMWRFAGSHAISGVAQHALPLVAMNGLLVAGLLLKSSNDA